MLEKTYYRKKILKEDDGKEGQNFKLILLISYNLDGNLPKS